MQQILCFFVSIFIFSSLFVSSVKPLGEKQKSREAKQNLNTAGREVVNHIEYDNGKFKINEETYLKSISSLNNSCEIIGAIFNYEECITVAKKKENEVIVKKVSAKQMNKSNRRNSVNSLLGFLFDEKDKEIYINIALEEEGDFFNEELFNKMKENTAFIIGLKESKVIVSGFELIKQ